MLNFISDQEYKNGCILNYSIVIHGYVNIDPKNVGNYNAIFNHPISLIISLNFNFNNNHDNYIVHTIHCYLIIIPKKFINLIPHSYDV